MRELVVALGKQGLTGQEIAETIWLAQKTVQIDFIGDTTQPGSEKTKDDSGESSGGDSGGATNTDAAANEPQSEIRPAPTDRSPSLALPPGYKTISVPDARSLTQPLQLARALRPLARQVAVGMPTILDETATVEAVAETGVWQPILKPDSELWLDVALVFDTSPSMSLWQRLSKDLHRLLTRYGEFRDVRLWQLKYERDTIQLTSRRGVPHRPKELLTGDRRRLIVVVSDCVAPAWYDGTMPHLLNTWATKLPTVVFHVFPERLWARTALVKSVPVKFKPRRAGMPSNALQPLPRSVWDIERLATTMRQPTVRLPVVSLEANSLASLANVVAGDRRARVLGIVWSDRASESESDLSQGPSTIDDLTDNFVLTASAMARELASLLAAAPVITLPVVRLIRNSMLPRASAVHDAEVLMSGLLVVSGDQMPTYEEAEKIAYEIFNDAVRDRLRAGYSKIDALTVIEKVSKYIARGLGKSVSEFKALLTVSGEGTTPAETEFLNAFATVTASILRGLGGEFRAIADSFAPPSEETEDVDAINDWFAGFTYEKLIYEVAEYLNIPEIINIPFTEGLLNDDTWPPGLKSNNFQIASIEIQSIESNKSMRGTFNPAVATPTYSEAENGNPSEAEDDTNSINVSLLKRDELDIIKSYCRLRQSLSPDDSRASLDYVETDEIEYWLHQLDRIIAKCRDSGPSISCESLLNSFVLSSLVKRVESVPPDTITSETFRELLQNLHLDQDFLERYIAISAERYVRSLIFRTWSLVVYVNSWSPGQDSQMHHIGYALEAIKVIQGTMTYWQLSPEEASNNVPFESEFRSMPYEGPSMTVRVGETVVVDRLYGYQIANLSDRLLVTLHVRLGHPPEDYHWRSTNDTEMFVWNQTEGCFDVIYTPGFFDSDSVE